MTSAIRNVTKVIASSTTAIRATRRTRNASTGFYSADADVVGVLRLMVGGVVRVALDLRADHRRVLRQRSVDLDVVVADELLRLLVQRAAGRVAAQRLRL